MEKEKCSCGNLHPFVVFWLGVLTGALLVGLAFFYGMWQTQEGQNAILKMRTKTLQTQPVGRDRGGITNPVGGDRGGMVSQ
ncbi:MAG: hypothetical protein WC269_02965 [Candidatus Gracilibacteria bacterium]|jgi:hypothetical protein